MSDDSQMAARVPKRLQFSGADYAKKLASLVGKEGITEVEVNLIRMSAAGSLYRKRVTNPIWRTGVAAGQDGRHREVRDEEAGVDDVGTGAGDARCAQ